MKLPTDPRAWLPFAAWAGGGLLVIGLISVAIYQFVLLPRENATRKATGIVQEATIEGLGDASADALEITRETHTEHVRIEEITRRNEDAIKAATGADTRVPGVARALVRGLCEHRAYLGHAGCPPVLGDDGGLRPAGSDDGSAVAD